MNYPVALEPTNVEYGLMKYSENVENQAKESSEVRPANGIRKVIERMVKGIESRR